eukprot:SAG11_NODE_2360_length_3462_cov_2.125186_1_plen_267_part_10
MSYEMERDNANLVEPNGHSTHGTQQLDQDGGPIFHAKRIMTSLVRHAYRNTSGLSHAVVLRCIELGVALSHTPAVCAYTTDRVGWREDESGGLVYDPMRKPHIRAMLVNVDEAAANASGERHEYLDRMQTEDPDVLAAAKASMKEVFGDKRKVWSGEAESGEAELDPSRSRTRRKKNNGCILTLQSWRDTRKDAAAEKAAAELAQKVKLCKEYKRATDALDESTIVEAAIEAHDGCFTTAKILLDQLKSFVYVRTADYAAISKMKKP